MALTWGEVQRLKFETGYNAANVGAELYVLNGYAAVFDSAIAPYLVDQGTTSTTSFAGSSTPVATAVTLAANPPVTGAVVNVYGNVFSVGAKVVVDVGPNQEQDIVIVGLSGLVATMFLQKPHGAYGAYPVVLEGGEFRVRDILARLDNINAQLRGFAPTVAGIAAADQDAKFFASQRGKRGQMGVTDDLLNQRDWARKDLAALLGIPNLWEMRGKYNNSGLSYEPY